MKLKRNRNKGQQREISPEEADILKVAGFPLTTGSGTISTPATFTA